ncbi:FeoA family protein [Bifidobacterium apri]|uniref:FeoA family protein n=2 Tax=Bifidobacterium apri TaxID=1769423 RepID=A0A6A2VUA7_9BIFI|nr:FeoA family protein [Bifidobacterium apri]
MEGSRIVVMKGKRNRRFQGWKRGNPANPSFGKGLGYCQSMMEQEERTNDVANPAHDRHETGPAEQTAHHTPHGPEREPEALTAETCPVRQDMTITEIRMDARHRLRMLELGIRVGAVTQVTQRSNFGGRVLAVGTGRIAIDGATARSILVTPIPAAQAAHETHGDNR